MIEAILATIVIGLLALAAGWFIGRRDVSRAQAERQRLDERLRGVEGDLSAARARLEQLDQLRAALQAATAERDESVRSLAALRAGAAEREEGYQAQLKQLNEAREALTAQFSQIGARLLESAQRQFLDNANQRFQEAGARSEGQLKALLAPVETTLKRYDEKLAEIEKARVGSYADLSRAIADLNQSNQVVRTETQRLANVMTASPKARGRWGEEQLRTILESAGLAENVDFTMQTAVSDGDRQLRPDCVIRLPGGRCIVVDVKCPLVAFEQAWDEEDEARRAQLLLQHANAMKSYAADLGRKGYWAQFDQSPDFVIMFIPGEHFLSAAAERAPDLIDTAFRQKVIVASTINMLALARVMAGMWRQEALAAQAEEIAEAGKELYKRLSTMGGHVHKLGRNLGQAAGAYNDFVGSLESQVYTQARRFEALKVETGGRSIDTPPVVDTAIRPLTKLSALPAAANGEGEGTGEGEDEAAE